MCLYGDVGIPASFPHGFFSEGRNDLQIDLSQGRIRPLCVLSPGVVPVKYQLQVKRVREVLTLVHGAGP